ncbi:DinB family protein [Dyadobacter sp. CY343]|uniref:DinB family protein n=1 Tax=Dyadobacter sp. CY343 TaxID=2907299 RepID=UPI001F343730|nr:DinB family protein [Dyadobacter sp. CY343]MCE7059673.1 DinB family protein [Dyadobacter sp. CY343]
MKRSNIQPMPPFFDRYINIIEDIDLFDAFEKHTPSTVYVEIAKLEAMGDRVYAPGKWTMKDILQHVVDNERIMAYRALRFSRGDKTPLAGYEEELLAANTLAETRSIGDLMEEFEQVRTATIPLFRNMSESMLMSAGTADGKQITPLALGFVILGHPVHHMNVIRERYFPLL